MNKATSSNQSLLIEIKRELKEVKNVVLDINKRNKLLNSELQKANQEIVDLNRSPSIDITSSVLRSSPINTLMPSIIDSIVDLNRRMPERKQGWFTGGYWEVKDGLTTNYENINNK